MEEIKNQTFDEERALYGSRGVRVRDCAFDGPADGESALKESRDVIAERCFCNLRYPFWHDTVLTLTDCELTELCRAALWYSKDVTISDCQLHGIKALRECRRVAMRDCDVVSPEFGWSTAGIDMENCRAESEYFLLRASKLNFRNVTLKGKYSFQYVKNAVLTDCKLDTKDAFWHAENVILINCDVKGEYLAWYSDRVTLINCRISGTQPLCYCKHLKLVNCEMTGTDLAFEKSEVNATVTTKIDSVKNPRKGKITAPAIGEIIMDDPAAKGKIVTA